MTALECGYDNLQEYRDTKKEWEERNYQDEKTDFENSVLNDIIGADFFTELSKEFFVNIKKVMRALANEAVKQGAELYHKSKEAGKVTSYYLKKDGKKVRISNHELPQIMHRSDPEYQETWHKNLTLGNNRFIMSLVRLTTRDEFSDFVKNLFLED